MPKLKTVYTCSACGAQSPKWLGQCNDCGAWNTFSEEINNTGSGNRNPRLAGYAQITAAGIQLLSQISLAEQPRFHTHLSELDRVLGGGLVAGSVI